MNEGEYILGINLVKGISPKIFYDLYDYFESIEAVYNASYEELRECTIFNEELLGNFITYKNENILEKNLNILDKKNISYLTIADHEYPTILKHIHLPPPVLYYKGNIRKELFSQCISIVGSRKASYYGLKMSEKMAFELGEAQITIVSGLARGVDTMAHVGAIKANAKTIAVLGCGIDVIYPKENKQLYHDITRSGLIISEFPPGTPPYAYNFPQRNRIISGLSMGTVIIEASTKSGSLITAKYALEQGREVYALPGNINNSNSMGTNSLIREGAKIVLETKDILDDIFPMFSSHEKSSAQESEEILTKEEQRILELIKLGFTDADKIYQKCDYNISTINAILTKLELKKRILIHKGDYFIK